MPYDSNQTVTFQTPDSDYCNIRISGDYSISSTPKLDLNNMNIYDPRRPGSCVVPYSQTSTGSGSKILLSTIPVYIPTPKLCRKMNFFTLLDLIAQCKPPGNSMTHYKPGVTAQSQSPYFPELSRSGSLHTYVPTPKSVLSARNPKSVLIMMY